MQASFVILEFFAIGNLEIEYNPFVTVHSEDYFITNYAHALIGNDPSFAIKFLP
jgi:hypothetical protein